MTNGLIANVEINPGSIEKVYAILYEQHTGDGPGREWIPYKMYNNCRPKTLKRAKRKLRQLRDTHKYSVRFKLSKLWVIVQEEKQTHEKENKTQIETSYGGDRGLVGGLSPADIGRIFSLRLGTTDGLGIAHNPTQEEISVEEKEGSGSTEIDSSDPGI